MVLAHGAAGPFDEVFFVILAFGFALTLWFLGRSERNDDDPG